MIEYLFISKFCLFKTEHNAPNIVLPGGFIHVHHLRSEPILFSMLCYKIGAKSLLLFSLPPHGGGYL